MTISLVYFSEDPEVLNFYANDAIAYEGDSGLDLIAVIKSPLTMNPLDRVIVGTGIGITGADGFCVQYTGGSIEEIHYDVNVRSRSGMSISNGIVVLNSPGTIDSGYTGEIKVILINLSNKQYILQPHTKVAQLVVCLSTRNFDTKINLPNQHDTLFSPKETRKDKGFGSSDVISQ